MEKFKEEKKRVLKYEDLFNIDQWYHKIKENTFQSELIDLSIQEAKSIIAFYKLTLQKKSKELSIEDKQVLKKLETRIDDSISQMIKSKVCSGVFVRLSSRSPKDAPIFDHYNIEACERMKKNLYKNFMKIDYSKEDVYITQQEYYAFAISIHQALKVTNGHEAMDLLCNSERIYVDLLKQIEYSDEFKCKVLIREWKEIPYELEFRSFVYNNQLNAISQYDYNIYLNYLIVNKETIKNVIHEYFEKEVKSKLEYLKNYVIDFGITSKKEKVYVIELNPFNTEESQGTGGSLFNWKEDQKILENGPLEIRINEKLESLPLNPDWDEYIFKLREIVKKEQSKDDICIIF